MHKKEKFEYIKDIPSGELIAKFPGLDLKMPYEKGKCYIAKENNIIQLKLTIKDILPKKTGKTKDKTKKELYLFAEELNKPQAKASLTKFLIKHDYSLFYSKTEDGTEIISIPELSKECQINNKDISGVVLATYPLKQHPRADPYLLHTLAIGNKKLISNKEELEKGILGLVSKINGIYEKGFVKKKPKSLLDRLVAPMDKYMNKKYTEQKQREEMFEDEDMLESLVEMNKIFGITLTGENPERYL